MPGFIAREYLFGAREHFLDVRERFLSPRECFLVAKTIGGNFCPGCEPERVLYYAPRPAEQSDAGRRAFYFSPNSDSYQVTTG